MDPEHDALLGLRGTGREIWADEHADEYVRRLREEPMLGRADELCTSPLPPHAER